MSKSPLQGLLWASKPWSQEQIESLEGRFAKLLGADVTFQAQVDSSLIGGFIARINGKVYDASLRGRLSHIHAASKQTELDPKSGLQQILIDESTLEETAPDKTLAMEDVQRMVQRFSPESSVYETGTVASSSDGVVFIDELKGRRYGELLEFENNVYGMAMELVGERVGAVLFSGADRVNAGSQASGSGRVVEIPVGEALIGRVVDPIGRPLDGRSLSNEQSQPIETPAPTIIDRQAVNQPLATGLLAIDSMIPIGRGQRELIIGDRQTGKTQIAIDAILNQSESGVICVYCAIGQKASTVAQIIDTLTEKDAMRYSVVVAATASDSPALQYIAPYSACSIAEYFMEQGRDVLIVYDDLSKHAVAYRTMSLLLHRPPGREAYPGDVFYLHSRLLERSAHLNDEKGGGSMTALPIVETQAGDISAYIPTNIISITDGQIFLETELFHAGIRPAVNVGLSVSRVGRAAQHKAMRQVSGTLRIELAQYRELAVFAQFSSDIDASTKRQLDRGERLTQLLRQDKQRPMRLSEQVVLLLAFQQDALREVETAKVGAFREDLLDAMQIACGVEMKKIDASGDMDEATKAALTAAIQNHVEHNQTVLAAAAPAEGARP